MEMWQSLRGAVTHYLNVVLQWFYSNNELEDVEVDDLSDFDYLI